jgi:hypothetical protein
LTDRTRRNLLPRFSSAALALLFLTCIVIAPRPSAGQSGRPAKAKADAPTPAPSPLLKRTATRREVRRLGYGGSVTVYGAPEGSVTVEGWSRNEVEVTAEVELNADTEEELARLAELNGFVVDEDYNHVRVVTTGTHDRQFLKRAARDLPKKLRELPWKIDYHIRVPALSDLELYSGRGALTLGGFEGALRLNAGDGPASLTLAGGDVEATLRGGPVTVRVPTRNWRGRGLSVRLASGDLTVELPNGFSGDLDAEVLRAGRVENTHPGLAPRERTQNNDRALHARAGHGGATLSFTVGEGTLRIRPEGAKQ